MISPNLQAQVELTAKSVIGTTEDPVLWFATFGNPLDSQKDNAITTASDKQRGNRMRSV